MFHQPEHVHDEVFGCKYGPWTNSLVGMLIQKYLHLFSAIGTTINQCLFLRLPDPGKVLWCELEHQTC